MSVMTKSSGERESPWKMPLLMLTAPSGDFPENKCLPVFHAVL